MIRKLLEFSKDGTSAPTGLAFIYFCIDEKIKAFQWLEKAYDERSSWMRYLVGEQLLDDIRLNPRFITLLRKKELTK